MIHALAAGWGHLIGRYGRARVNKRTVEVIQEAPLPDEPFVFVGWHEANLVTVALHHLVSSRQAIAFVPPGLTGSAVAGWLAACGIAPMSLPHTHGGLLLRRMREALHDGADVLVALDGPHGPRRKPKAGALWLAGSAGVRITPVGCAARPALYVPRWDRHLVPLPGARIVVVTGRPISIGAGARSPAASERLAAVLDRLMARAAQALARPAGATPMPSRERETAG